MAKKTKGVETPIDQKETFVSLQKSFADDVNVAEKLKTLYELQQADNEIDKLVQLRGELPAEVKALEEEMAEMTQKSEAISGMIEQYTKNIAHHKQAVAECDAQIATYQKQLEGIANSLQYDSINKEIENQGLERQIAEKNILESKSAISAAKADLEDLKDHMSIREEDLASKKEELEAIVVGTAKEEAALVAKRDACAAKIDARTMSAYNRIRESVHNHLAVVSVYNGDSCGGCFNTVTPQRLIEIAGNKKLVICEHCGRIIVNPEFDKSE